MTITRVQSVYTVTGDMERAQQFYAAGVGLTPAFRDGNKWSQFSVGNASFALSSADEAAPGAGGSVVVFESSDLEGSRNSIEKAGGRLVSKRDMGTHGSVLTFTDPEGNLFQVFAKKAKVG